MALFSIATLNVQAEKIDLTGVWFINGNRWELKHVEGQPACGRSLAMTDVIDGHREYFVLCAEIVDRNRLNVTVTFRSKTTAVCDGDYRPNSTYQGACNAEGKRSKFVAFRDAGNNSK
jgi:hypothetical protein